MNRREFLNRSALGATASLVAAVALTASARAGVAVRAPPVEAAIEPDLPIVDAHHHLWDQPARGDRPTNRYLLPEFLADVGASGHNITKSVFVECMSMYRATGPEQLRSLGETEFVNGIAAMSASGNYGRCRVAAGIVSFVDLQLGDQVRQVLEAHVAAAGGRLKGVRSATAWDEYPVMGFPLDRARAGRLSDPDFSKGVATLASLGLVFESWIFHPQIRQLTTLATAHPDVTIVLGHLGTPIRVGPYAASGAAVFNDWKRDLQDLARRPNVVVKLGGLGMPFVEPALSARRPLPGSAEIALHWRPWIETCIEAFGPRRCMFESNFPPDAATCSYGTLWNVFKRITAGYSADEKNALFSGTAERVFRLSDSG